MNKNLPIIRIDLIGMRSNINAWAQTEKFRKIFEVIIAISAGVFIGTIMLISKGLDNRWGGLILIATVAPTFVLLVKDIKKLLLIVFVVDIPLGLDIALYNQVGFSGGLSGFLISPMSIGLVVGYTTWAIKKKTSSKKLIHSNIDITIPAMLFVFMILVSTYFAINQIYSIYSVFLHIQFLLMFFYIINHIKDDTGIRLIVNTLIACVIFESTIMIWQYFTGDEFSFLGIKSRLDEAAIIDGNGRVGGTLGAPNTAATFMIITLPIIYATNFIKNWQGNKIITSAAMFMGIAALLTTQSRAGIILFAIAISIVTAVTLWKTRNTKVIAPLLLIAVVILGGVSTQFIERFSTTGDDSALSRLWYNELALNVIGDYGFTGIGSNNQRFIIDDPTYIPFEAIGKNRTVIHNKYLSLWVELGVLGLLSFLYLLFAVGKRALHTIFYSKNINSSILISGMLAALVGYSGQMAVATFTGRARLQMLWLIMALITAATNVANQSSKISHK